MKIYNLENNHKFDKLMDCQISDYIIYFIIKSEMIFVIRFL